jgi:ABC-2 type transport system permease protein
VEGTGIWSVLGIQVFWFVILLIPMMLIWRQARKRLFVQGG